MQRAYEEVINFIAQGTTPNNIVAFRPSQESAERVADLLRRNKNDALNEDERSELDHYLQLEHLMRMAKAKARQHLNR